MRDAGENRRERGQCEHRETDLRSVVEPPRKFFAPLSPRPVRQQPSHHHCERQPRERAEAHAEQQPVVRPERRDGQAAKHQRGGDERDEFRPIENGGANRRAGGEEQPTAGGQFQLGDQVARRRPERHLRRLHEQPRLRRLVPRHMHGVLAGGEGQSQRALLQRQRLGLAIYPNRLQRRPRRQRDGVAGAGCAAVAGRERGSARAGADARLQPGAVERQRVAGHRLRSLACHRQRLAAARVEPRQANGLPVVALALRHAVKRDAPDIADVEAPHFPPRVVGRRLQGHLRAHRQRRPPRIGCLPRAHGHRDGARLHTVFAADNGFAVEQRHAQADRPRRGRHATHGGVHMPLPRHADHPFHAHEGWNARGRPGG